MGKDAALRPPAPPVRVGLPGEIRVVKGLGSRVCRLFLCPTFGPGDSGGVVLDIFGKIHHLRGDPPVKVMDIRIVGFAQGNDQDADPTLFQSENLLGDKGFGQARVAFDHNGDTGHRGP